MLSIVATRPGAGTWRAELSAARAGTSPVMCLPRSLEDLRVSAPADVALVNQLVQFLPQTRPFLSSEMYSDLKDAVTGLLPHYTTSWNLMLEVSLNFNSRPSYGVQDGHDAYLAPQGPSHHERVHALAGRLETMVASGALPGAVLAELSRCLDSWPDLKWSLLISLNGVSPEARAWLEEGLLALAKSSLRVRLVVDYPTSVWLEQLLKISVQYQHIDAAWADGDDALFVVTGGQPRLADALLNDPAPLAAPTLDEARAQLRSALSSTDDPRLRALQSAYKRELQWLLSDEYASERERLLKIGLHPLESDGLPAGMGADKDPIDDQLLQAGLLVPWLICPEHLRTTEISGLKLTARRLLERCRHRFGWLERDEDKEDAQQLLTRGLISRRLIVPDAPMLDFLTGHAEITQVEFSDYGDRPMRVSIRVAGQSTTHSLTRQEMVVFLLLVHRAVHYRCSLSKGQLQFAMMYILTRLAEVGGASYLQNPPKLARLIVMLTGRFADVRRFGEHLIRPWQGERNSHYGLIGVRVLSSTRLFHKFEQLFEDGRGILDFDHILHLYEQLRKPGAMLDAFECVAEKNHKYLTLRYQSWSVVITPTQIPARKARFQSFGHELIREYFQLPEQICPELEWDE